MSTDQTAIDQPVTACTLKVGIAALRAAIAAVVPHADKVRLGDEDLALARVRLIAGAEELLVVATNIGTESSTTAMAAVEIEEDDRTERFAAFDGPFTVDLHPAKARDIVRQIKPVKADEDGDPGPSSTGWASLRLALDSVRVTDVSGLWPGTRLTVPVLDYRPQYPDVPSLVGRALEAAAGTFKPLTIPHGVASRFDMAARQFEKALEWEPVGSADASGWVVLCGPQFAGLAESNHGGGNSLKARDKRRMTHLERAGLAPKLTAL